MKHKNMVDQLVEEVVRSNQPDHVLEQYMSGVKDHLEREQNIVESLLSLYPNLEEVDADIFDYAMDRYYDDESYSIADALSEMLRSHSSQFMNHRLAEMVKRYQVKLI